MTGPGGSTTPAEVCHPASLPIHRIMRAAIALLAACVLIALAGCGGNSKPAYCSDRSDLENSIKGLTSVDLSSGLSGLRSQLATIESDATTLVDSARSDFPDQTSAIRSSVDTLAAAVRTLQANPTAQQTAAVVGDASNVVSAVGDFKSASNSKCD